METFAQRLIRLLERKNNNNQSELARFVGVSPQAVQKWAAGKGQPRGDNLTRTAEFFGISKAGLLFGDENTGHFHPEPQGEKTAKLVQSHDVASEPSADEMLQMMSLFKNSRVEVRQLLLDTAKAMIDAVESAAINQVN